MLLLRIPYPHNKNQGGDSNNVVVELVVKANIGELNEEVWAGSLRKIRKELTGVLQEVLGKNRFLVRFKDKHGNNLSSNQFNIMIVERKLEEKEPEIFAIPGIPEEQVEFEKGYYRCVYIIIWFKKGY